MGEEMIPTLSEVIEHLYQNAPAFQSRMQTAGLTPTDLQSAADLQKLPVFRKDELFQLQQGNPPFGGLLAVPMSEVAAVFQSPGPLYEPIGRQRPVSGWAKAMAAAGFKAGEVVMNALGYHMTPAGLAGHEAITQIGAVVLPGGIGNQDQQIEAMVALNVKGYIGLPSYLKMLIELAESKGTPLHIDHALVLAEPLPPSLRAWFREKGVAVYNAYGTAECGALGYEDQSQDGWIVPETAIVQICDIETGEPLPHGETGEVVATILSKTYAVIRFGTGDLSSYSEKTMADGSTALRLNGWQGRIGMATKVRGMFLHPVQLMGMMGRFEEVERFQAVVTRQDHRDDITLQVVPKEGIDTSGLATKIQAAARSAIKFKLDVNLVSPSSLPAGAPPIKDERKWN